MQLNRRSFLALLMASGLARAETFPSQPIRLVIPYAPGGGTDLLGRLIAKSLSERLKQNVVVENRPGGSGSIAVNLVANSAPNGYTLLLGANPVVLNHVLAQSASVINPLTALAPITLYATAPLLVLVSPSVPANSLQELIALAKASPGKYNYASSGNGSSNHLAGALLASAAKVDITHVPYKGVGPAMNDVMAGRVQIFISSAFSSISQVRAKQVKALAVASSSRLPLLPDIPTTDEAGLPELKVDAWWGAFAHKDTPEPIVRALRDAIVADISQPEIKGTLETQNAIAVGSTPRAFAEFLEAETQKWTKVAKFAGMTTG
ncbi:MAG: Bug family tripartite tricarboxylate transporter substrate binding protein [Burkholderiaceae bacterium]